MQCDKKYVLKKMAYSLYPRNEVVRRMKIAQMAEDVGYIEQLLFVESFIDSLVDEVSEDDILDMYEDEELCLIDEDSGEVIDFDQDFMLSEVLSRTERMKSKMRMLRSQPKMSRRLSIALKRRSTSDVLRKRARRAAVNAIKKRLAGKSLKNLSVAEKERIERILHRSKFAVNRATNRMISKVSSIESKRLAKR